MVADCKLFEKLVGRRCLELFHPKLQSLRFRLGREDDRAYNLPGFHNFAGMLDPLFIREVGNMDETFNPFFDLDEGAELRKFCNFAFDYFSAGITVLNGVPRILEDLPQSQT